MNSLQSAHFGANKNPNRPRKPKYLTKRRKVFWFKRKVPRDVAKVFPRARSGTVWQSLKTQDEGEAHEKLRDAIADFDRAVELARGRLDIEALRIEKAKSRPLGTDKYLLREHVAVIIAAYQAQTLRVDESFRESLGKDSNLSLDDKLAVLAKHTTQLQSRLALCKQARTLRSVEIVAAEAAVLLKEHGLIAPPNSHAHQELLHGLARAEVALLEEQLLRLEGAERMKTPPEDVALRRARALVTLRCSHATWARTQENAKTVDTYAMYVAEFEALLGAVPLVGLTKFHVEQYRDWLEAKHVRLDTAKNRIGGLATLFSHAVSAAKTSDSHVGLANPFRAISLSGFTRKASGDVRRPFTMAELQKLFSSELYTRSYEARGQAREALYWCFPIGIYAGPRIEELAQLRSEDVHKVEGEWVFNFREESAEQSLKNYWSRRLVPVHPELHRLGFLEYVQERRSDSSNPMLFPSLKSDNKYRVWSAALSKSVGRYLSRIGLEDSRLDFHSLRYVFRQQCANCGVMPEAAERLLGHWIERDDSSSVYLTNQGFLYPLPALVNAIHTVQYTDLDLSHIGAQLLL